MNKKEKAIQAINHFYKMEKEYSDKIAWCNARTKYYSGFVPGSIVNKTKKTNEKNLNYLEIWETDTVNAIKKAVSEFPDSKIAALNFASFKYPGGGFLKGSSAQEESLCHKSILYNILWRQREEFYGENKNLINRGLYWNRAIYSPNVLFEDFYNCDIITCAAPNKKEAKRNGITDEENTKALKERISFILDIAAKNKVDVLILGAFGCGAFGQDPNEVKKIFMKLSNNYIFKKIIFAIPNGSNLDAFRSLV